jgi:hypothetical protein
MALVEKKGEVPGVVERPEVPEIPPSVERKTGVSVRPQNFNAPSMRHQGQQVFTTPQTQTVSIQLPADQGQIKGWAGGPVTSALTWFARFWLRIIKKAHHFGWRIIGKSNASN